MPPTVLTEGRHGPEFLMSEANSQRSRETVTVASGSGVLPSGLVLGIVTASGKYEPSANAEVLGSEGAETGVAVLMYGVDATSADVEVAVIRRDAEVNTNIISFDSSVDNDAKKIAKRAQLAAVGIIAR